MSVVDLARGLVLRTNRWPALERIYHHAYELGLNFTTRRLESLPDIIAVLLRVGEDGRVWVPGLSDYDLTLLTEPCTPSRMIGVLEDVWARYRRIKRYVPQLGETEILNLGEYEDLLSFGPPPTASLKRAQPLFVRSGRPDVERVLQRSAPAPQERDFLLDAVSRYVRFFVPAWLDHVSEPSHVSGQRAEHLLGNVRKRLQVLELAEETPPRTTFADRTLCLFNDLSRACRRITSRVDEGAPVVCPGSRPVRGEAIAAVRAFCTDALRHTKVHDCSIIVWVSYMSSDTLNLVFVIPDETPGPELWRLVTSLGSAHRQTKGLWSSLFTNGELQAYFPSFSYPVVVSRSIWSCWRELSPFDGAAVAANGRTLMGPENGLRSVPSTAALKRGAAIQYTALLSLKNNWRPLPGSGTPRLYGSMINYVKGYASAASGSVLTSPTRHDFTSLESAYQAVSEELSVLRQTLTR